MAKINVSNLPGTGNASEKVLNGLRAITAGRTFITTDYDDVVTLQGILFRGLKVHGWEETFSGLSKRYYTEDGNSQFMVVDNKYVSGKTMYYEVFGYLSKAHYEALLNG